MQKPNKQKTFIQAKMLSGNSVFAILALVFSILLPVIFLCLYCFKVVDVRVMILLFVGFMIGYAWEFVHIAAPNQFMKIVDKDVSQHYPFRTLYPIVHSMGDAFVFLSSLLLVYLLGLKLSSPWALCVMILFGVSIAVIAETSNNGKYWFYGEKTPGNPVVYRLANGIGYTLWPVLEWLFASILFWLAANAVYTFVKSE